MTDFGLRWRSSPMRCTDHPSFHRRATARGLASLLAAMISGSPLWARADGGENPWVGT